MVEILHVSVDQTSHVHNDSDSVFIVQDLAGTGNEDADNVQEAGDANESTVCHNVVEMIEHVCNDQAHYVDEDDLDICTTSTNRKVNASVCCCV